MLALLQRLIVLALVAALMAGLLAALLLGRPALAAIPPAAVIIGYLSALAIEFWLLRRSCDSSDPLLPRRGDLISAWIGEIFAAPRAFLWRQPFLCNRIPDDLPATSAARRGVVLVHGFFCNRGLWNPWLKRLRHERVPFIAVNLEPVFGAIDDYRETIANAAARLEQASSLAPVIVAHSMGGLAVRAWLATMSDSSAVHRVVTIASPHSGTRFARHSFAANVAVMRVDSPWLKSLWSREPASTRAKFICFWSHCDNIVFPTRNATLPEADNRHLKATAHVQMALHPAALAAVLELVAVDIAASEP